VTDLPTGDEILLTMECALGTAVSVTDPGLLESSLRRPATVVAGKDAYPEVWDKAAALLHSLTGAGCLAEGNESAGWAACWLPLGLNGEHVSPQLDAESAAEFVHAVAANAMIWEQISARLPQFAE
jgi:death-on-curing protein